MESGLNFPRIGSRFRKNLKFELNFKDLFKEISKLCLKGFEISLSESLKNLKTILHQFSQRETESIASFPGVYTKLIQFVYTKPFTFHFQSPQTWVVYNEYLLHSILPSSPPINQQLNNKIIKKSKKRLMIPHFSCMLNFFLYFLSKLLCTQFHFIYILISYMMGKLI